GFSCDCRPFVGKDDQACLLPPACPFRSAGGAGRVLCCCGAPLISIRRRRGVWNWWSPIGISPPSSPSSSRNGSVGAWATATRRRC
ncbi:unnamed protein product, partial [Ectocarpus fasciculatus]